MSYLGIGLLVVAVVIATFYGTVYLCVKIFEEMFWRRGKK